MKALLQHRLLTHGLWRTRLVREGGWVTAGQLITALAMLVSVRLLTEILEPDAFGELALLVGVAALALGLAATPTLQAVIRYYPDQLRQGRLGDLRVVSRGMVARSTVIAAFVIAAAWPVAGHAFGGSWFTGLLVAALLAVDVVRSFEVSLLHAARRQAATAVYYAADACARPLAALAAVMALGSTAEAALTGYIVGAGLVVAAMHLIVRPEGRTPGEPPATDPRRAVALGTAIRRYALPLVPLAIFAWISGLGDRYLIGGMLSLEQAGLYAAVYGLVSRPFLMVAGIVDQTVRPVLQNAIAAGDPKRLASAKRAWLMATGAGAILGFVAFVLLGELVGRLLLAEEYRSVIKLMPWVAAGYAIYIVSNVFSRFCYVFDDTKAVLLLTIIGSVIGIVVLLPAVHFYGLQGAAAVVPVRFGIELALSAMFARRAERSFSLRHPETLGLRK